MRTNDVVCVGSVFLDYVVSLESIPKKPIKVKAKRIEKKLGGSAAVASFTIKRLGVQSEFVGRFGDDDGSNFLKSEFSSKIPIFDFRKKSTKISIFQKMSKIF